MKEKEKEKEELRTLMRYLQNKKQRNKKESEKTPCKYKDEGVELKKKRVKKKDKFIHVFLQTLINEHKNENTNEWSQRSHLFTISNQTSASTAVQNEIKENRKNYKSVYDHFEKDIDAHLNTKTKRVISSAFADTTLDNIKKKDKHNYIPMSITNIQKGFYGNFELRTMASLQNEARYFKDSLCEDREMYIKMNKKKKKKQHKTKQNKTKDPELRMHSEDLNFFFHF